MKYMLQKISEEKLTQSTTRETSKFTKIKVFRDIDLQSWRGEGQNEVYVPNLHCSRGSLISTLDKSVE